MTTGTVTVLALVDSLRAVGDVVRKLAVEAG